MYADTHRSLDLQHVSKCIQKVGCSFRHDISTTVNLTIWAACCHDILTCKGYSRILFPLGRHISWSNAMHGVATKLNDNEQKCVQTNEHELRWIAMNQNE